MHTAVVSKVNDLQRDEMKNKTGDMKHVLIRSQMAYVQEEKRKEGKILNFENLAIAEQNAKLLNISQDIVKEEISKLQQSY